MTELGYFLSSEEHAPSTLVRNALRAEQAGFGFTLLSDHFHPWIKAQGHAPFAWSVLGGIATATERIRFGTAVTCPIQRIHPALVAQAAATVATMAPGRFLLGLGTGEALNEHITGERWPSAQERLDRLAEAIGIIRELWTGELVSHQGLFTVDRARLLTLPERPPAILVSASGTDAAKLAATTDGLITASPSRETVDAFESAGGRDGMRITMLRVCWSSDRDAARELVKQQWPNAAFTGSMHTDLALPEDFEEAVRLVREEDLSDIVVGDDPAAIIEAIRSASNDGYDHVVLHQIGPEQEAFIEAMASDVLPACAGERRNSVQLDEMVEETFPASDPISTWAGADHAPA